MSVIDIVDLCGLVVLGVIACYTDIKYKKAYNKHLIFFLVIGLGLLAVSLLQDTSIAWQVMVNYALVILLSVLFYSFDVWAAGDAKLFMIMALFIPVGMMKRLGISPVMLLGIVFTLAFIYVVLESVVLIALEIIHKEFDWKYYLKVPKNSFVYILAVFTIVDTIDMLLTVNGAFQFLTIPGLMQLFNCLVTILLLTLIRENKISIKLLVVLTVIKVALHVFFSVGMTARAINIIVMVIVFAILKNITGKFNYSEIATADVKTGMVLSRMTVMIMSRSTVKGLPKQIDETTRFRITEEEAMSIRRWEKSKYGESSIVIVRTIPFAPFIFAGMLMFIGLCLL